MAKQPLAAIAPMTDIAEALFSLFLGMELLINLDGRSERADRFFAIARALTLLAQPLLATKPAKQARRRANPA